MNLNDIKVLKKVQKESIEFNDFLGNHKGTIYELKIKDDGIFAYGIFFGRNLWLRLDERTMEWKPKQWRI